MLLEKEIEAINNDGNSVIKKQITEQKKRPTPKGWIPHRKCPKSIPKYDRRLNKKGQYEIIEDGTIDFYDEIQARGECCEIKDILKKYKINIKDFPSAEIDQSIEDTTIMPTDFTEQQNVIAKIKNTFSMLSKDERAIFGNNPNRFVNAIIEKDETLEKFNQSERMAKYIAKKEQQKQIAEATKAAQEAEAKAGQTQINQTQVNQTLDQTQTQTGVVYE